MNIRQLNESIHNFYTEDFSIDTVDEDDNIYNLRRMLSNVLSELKETNNTNPQIISMYVNSVIEDIFQKSWWEVTDCNVTELLLNGTSIDEITDCVIDNIRPEFKETEIVTEAVNNEYFVGDEESGRMYKGEVNAKRALKDLKAQGIAAVKIPATDESCKKNVTEDYDEPELLGKGYAAPISKDYVADIKQRVKYKDTDFTDIQKCINKTIDEIESFDNYWRTHKAAIMKNIEEAQDLIPVEYRI